MPSYGGYGSRRRPVRPDTSDYSRCDPAHNDGAAPHDALGPVGGNTRPRTIFDECARTALEVRVEQSPGCEKSNTEARLIRCLDELAVQWWLAHQPLQKRDALLLVEVGQDASSPNARSRILLFVGKISDCRCDLRCLLSQRLPGLLSDPGAAGVRQGDGFGDFAPWPGSPSDGSPHQLTAPLTLHNSSLTPTTNRRGQNTRFS